jgi:hypothetical protein
MISTRVDSERAVAGAGMVSPVTFIPTALNYARYAERFIVAVFARHREAFTGMAVNESHPIRV